MSKAIDELRKRRSALHAEIAETEVSLQGLLMSLTHIEATLRLLEPEITLKPPPKAKQKRAARGSVSRPVLSALRIAKGPVTTRDLAKAVLLSKGLPAVRVSTRALDQARYALKDLRARGIVVAVGNEGPVQTWALAPDVD